MIRPAILAILIASAALSDATVTGTVTRVVDGDTIYITGQPERLRIWGLDAPETRDPSGPAATATMKRLALGRIVQCRLTGAMTYGRPVAQCWLPDGRDLACAMISSGTAREWVKYSKGVYGRC